MKLKNVNELVQIVATVGVIFGLLMVAMELKQNTRLARAEMNAQTIEHQQVLFGALRNIEFSRVFRKSLETPGQLAIEEVIIMDGYYQDLVSRLIRENLMIARGIFEDDMDSVAANVVDQGLDTEFGRAWWLESKNKYPPGLIATIEQQLEKSDDDEFVNRLRRIQGELKNTN